MNVLMALLDVARCVQILREALSVRVWKDLHSGWTAKLVKVRRLSRDLPANTLKQCLGGFTICKTVFEGIVAYQFIVHISIKRLWYTHRT